MCDWICITMTEAKLRVREYWNLPCGQVITGLPRYAIQDVMGHRASCQTCTECKDFNMIVVRKNGHIERPRGASFRRENGQPGTMTKIVFEEGAIPLKETTDRLAFGQLVHHGEDGGYLALD